MYKYTRHIIENGFSTLARYSQKVKGKGKTLVFSIIETPERSGDAQQEVIGLGEVRQETQMQRGKCENTGRKKIKEKGEKERRQGTRRIEKERP